MHRKFPFDTVKFFFKKLTFTDIFTLSMLCYVVHEIFQNLLCDSISTRFCFYKKLKLRIESRCFLNLEANISDLTQSYLNIMYFLVECFHSAEIKFHITSIFWKILLLIDTNYSLKFLYKRVSYKIKDMYMGHSMYMLFVL